MTYWRDGAVDDDNDDEELGRSVNLGTKLLFEI